MHSSSKYNRDFPTLNKFKGEKNHRKEYENKEQVQKRIGHKQGNSYRRELDTSKFTRDLNSQARIELVFQVKSPTKERWARGLEGFDEERHSGSSTCSLQPNPDSSETAESRRPESNTDNQGKNRNKRVRSERCDM